MKIIKNIALIIFLLAINTCIAHSEDLKPINQSDNTTQPEIPQIDIGKEILFILTKDQVPITLEDALKTALENNFDIKIITTRKNRDKWLYYGNISDFLPDITYSFSETRLNGTILAAGIIPVQTGTNTAVNTGFTAQWDGFTGFKRYFDLKAAKNVYKASDKRLDLTKEQVLLLTATQYYALLQDKFNIEILKKTLESNMAQLRINTQRFEAGVGTKFDVIRSEAEVASSKQTLIAAINRFELSQARLANIIGVDVFASLMPEESNIEPKTLVKGNPGIYELNDILLKNKPDIAIAKLDIAAVKAKRNSAYSTYFPTVSVAGSISGAGDAVDNLKQNKFIALLINWQGGENLGFRGLANVKALGEQVKESRLNLVQTTRNLEQSLISSYYSSISAKEQIAAAKKGVDSAEESLRLSIIRLEAGVGIYTDVINAQLTETQAKIRYLNAIINYNTAQSQLLFDMGVISTGNLLEGYELTSEAKK